MASFIDDNGEIDLDAAQEELASAMDSAERFLPPNVRDRLTVARRALKKGISQLVARAEDGCSCGYCSPYDEVLPVEHARGLAEWARRGDPRTVGKALEAIRGGHVSDLSLIF
jgi:hypothetical protein